MSANYLVVRCSDLDGVNPIEEVNRVITAKGSCWFGKYGQPIRRKTKSGPGKPIFVVLALNFRMSKGGAASVYVLEEHAFKKPALGSYPDYYQKTLPRIGTWLRISPAKHPSIRADELFIKSSGKALPTALSDSMRGHFWCVGPDL